MTDFDFFFFRILTSNSSRILTNNSSRIHQKLASNPSIRRLLFNELLFVASYQETPRGAASFAASSTTDRALGSPEEDAPGRAGRSAACDTSGRLLLQNDDAANATSATLGAMASPLLHDARSPKPQQISPGGAAAELTADGAAAAVMQAMNGAPVDTLNHHTPMLTELVLEPSNYPRWWLLPVMALLGLLWIWAIRVYRREQRRYSKPTTAAREEEAAAGCHVA